MKNIFISLLFLPCALFADRFVLCNIEVEPVLHTSFVTIEDTERKIHYFYRMSKDDIWDHNPIDIMDFIIWHVPYDYDRANNDYVYQ